MSAAGASWYSGTGTPPGIARPAWTSTGAAVVADDGQIHAALEAEAASPQASARTSSLTCAQFQLCQMPRYFRETGGWGRSAHGFAASAEVVRGTSVSCCDVVHQCLLLLSLFV
jgi:hypothetical protein